MSKKNKTPNAMVQRSINNGVEFIIGKTSYFGKDPEYVKIEGFGFIKSKNGLPYVNMEKFNISK